MFYCGSQSARQRSCSASGIAAGCGHVDFDEQSGFSLQDLLGRKRDGSQVQVLPDDQGVIKAVLSPWNRDRMVVALSAQRDEGLAQVRDVWSRDDLFFQLKDDTVLIRANRPAPLGQEPQRYTLEFLQRSREQREITDSTGFDRLGAVFGAIG